MLAPGNLLSVGSHIHPGFYIPPPVVERGHCPWEDSGSVCFIQSQQLSNNSWTQPKRTLALIYGAMIVMDHCSRNYEHMSVSQAWNWLLSQAATASSCDLQQKLLLPLSTSRMGTGSFLALEWWLQSLSWDHEDPRFVTAALCLIAFCRNDARSGRGAKC